MSNRTTATRNILRLSAASIALATVASPAFAQGTDTGVTGPPESSIHSPHDTGAAPVAPPVATEHVPQIVINDNFTPGQAVDPVDEINGIGQLVTDNLAEGGGVGLCTGSLINPRMVLFAAHCVNSRPATAYGPGGKAIGVGFETDTFPGILAWIGSGNSTSLANNFYNINSIVYDPRSLALGPDLNFLEADIAIATLDTPASNIPTWTMLFSPLPAPDSIGLTTGTDYHVKLTGYGANGTGTLGSNGGIDFRRRSAENVLGILGSLDDVDTFLFGQPSGLPQNLYMIDFDDPTRDTPTDNPFDFNVFRDAALPEEGITAGGDSGGPLIIDEAFGPGVETIIGVLSGGTRYFGAQPRDSYGTSSFYQPLYLYWDYIVANNPYHYVSAQAGDGNWTDPTHWVTNIDPAYQVIGADGGLVNGLPDVVGEGPDGVDGKFGQICVQGFGINECVDLNTGESIVDDQPVPITDEEPEFASRTTNGMANVDLTGVLGGDTALTRTAAADTPEDGDAGSVTTMDVGTAEVPAPTFANGLPGASGFVPQNFDGDRVSGVQPSYFDVTLSAAGTTTLDEAVTIDRLTVAGMDAGLDITDDGTLLSLIDVTQFAGSVNVDGTLASVGDYAVIGGFLSGSGLVISPFVTNVAGFIAPGTIGSTGTLTVAGNLILSSGSTLIIDLGADGAGDLLDVRSLDGTDESGIASLGGSVIFMGANGFRPRAGDMSTFLRAENGIVGTFGAGSQLSAILFPQLTYSDDSVSVEILARNFVDVIDPASPIQAGFAQLLDQNRSNSDQLDTLFGELDLLQLDELRGNLELLAPRTEATRTALARMPGESLSRLYRDRIQLSRTGEAGGTLTMIGQPAEMLAAAGNFGSPMALQAGSSGSSNFDTEVRDVDLPSNVSVFIAGGYLDGDSSPLPGAINGGRDQLDGYFGAIGGEVSPQPGTVVGGSLAYSNTDGDAAFGQSVDGELYQASLYGAYTTNSGFMVSSQFSVGVFNSDTSRSVPVGGVTQDLTQSDSSLTIAGEMNIGKDFGNPDGIVLTPNVGLRYENIFFDRSAERGGDAALVFDRDNYESLQARAGLSLGGSLGIIKPRVTANYVHDFLDSGETFGANFVGGIGPNARFALPTNDGDWGEVGAAVRIGSGAVSVDLAADTTFERSDLDYQTYRATLNIQF